jgi:hypothetical protein
MEKPKMNRMAELAMQNKAFRESYQSHPQEDNKITATFLKNKEDKIKDSDIEKAMEWFRNQR